MEKSHSSLFLTVTLRTSDSGEGRGLTRWEPIEVVSGEQRIGDVGQRGCVDAGAVGSRAAVAGSREIRSRRPRAVQYGVSVIGRQSRSQLATTDSPRNAVFDIGRSYASGTSSVQRQTGPTRTSVRLACERRFRAKPGPFTNGYDSSA